MPCPQRPGCPLVWLQQSTAHMYLPGPILQLEILLEVDGSDGCEQVLFFFIVILFAFSTFAPQLVSWHLSSEDVNLLLRLLPGYHAPTNRRVSVALMSSCVDSSDIAPDLSVVLIADQGVSPHTTRRAALGDRRKCLSATREWDFGGWRHLVLQYL